MAESAAPPIPTESVPPPAPQEENLEDDNVQEEEEGPKVDYWIGKQKWEECLATIGIKDPSLADWPKYQNDIKNKLRDQLVRRAMACQFMAQNAQAQAKKADLAMQAAQQRSPQAAARFQTKFEETKKFLEDVSEEIKTIVALSLLMDPNWKIWDSASQMRAHYEKQQKEEIAKQNRLKEAEQKRKQAKEDAVKNKQEEEATRKQKEEAAEKAFRELMKEAEAKEKAKGGSPKAGPRKK